MAQHKQTWATGLAVFAAAWFIFLQNLPSPAPMHRDEANWSRVGVFAFRTFFVERDFSNPGWRNSFNRFGSENPQVGKYLLGASQWAMGYRDFDGVTAWQPGRSTAWHLEQGILPAPPRLYAARFPAAVSAALAAALIFAIITMLPGGSAAWGVLGAGLWVAAPLALAYGRLAMLDMPATTLSLLALACWLAAWRGAPGGRRFLLLAAATAVAAGLAMSTKLSHIFAWVAPPGWLVLAQAWGWWGARRGRGSLPLPWPLFAAALALLAAVPPLIFLLSNPFLYRDTAAGLLHMARLNEMLAQERALFPDVALYGPGARLAALLANAWGGAPLRPLWWLLSGGGLLWLGRAAWRGDRAAGIFLLWTAVCALSLLAGIHLARERWYLPLLPLAVISAVMGPVGLLALWRARRGLLIA